MKQILQNLSNGLTELADIPCPKVKPGHLLIQTSCSLVSSGTERMLVDFGKANLIDKARQQPDKVRMVVDKIKTDGLLPTLEAVKNKLDQPLAMGYCNVGTVIEVGEGVAGFEVGDRVASNGKHAEIVCVPKNLCAHVPDGASNESAAFTVIGAIALQGIRLIQATLGETIAVTGLGLIGLITVQLLRAQGCRVIGIDFDTEKLMLAQSFGAEIVDLSQGSDPVANAISYARGRGVDGVIITASTKSNEPMHQAAQMCRKRGRIVLVGVTGLELSRADFFEKELTFQVSCSYGPGRYDPLYEEGGQDYPFGYVRWTEQRNFEAVLDLLATGQLNVDALISHRFPIAEAVQAYDLLGNGQSALGILLNFPNVQSANFTRKITINHSIQQEEKVVIGVLGSGNYATQVLIPAFKKTGVRLKSVASASGVSGVHAAKKYGIDETTTDSSEVLSDPAINTIVVSTRHNSHAHYVCEALKHGKHVFCEKPLALTRDELSEIKEIYHTIAESKLLMVGFNRRFAPHIVKIKSLITPISEPKCFIMTVNAGAIPIEHWTQDREVGGGRIIGECCHFIDLLRHLSGCSITNFQATAIGKTPHIAVRDDKASITLAFEDGSFGVIHYLANGHKSFPKERLEIFCAGRILQLDNFRKLSAYGWPNFNKMNLWSQDKGQAACAAAFVEALRTGKSSPIPFNEIIEVSQITLDIAEQLR